MTKKQMAWQWIFLILVAIGFASDSIVVFMALFVGGVGYILIRLFRNKKDKLDTEKR